MENTQNNIDELLGKKFGLLTVVERAENDNYGRPRYLCKCDCGNTKVIYANNLKTGHTKSCGCQWKIGRKPKDLVGQKFGALTVIKSLGIKEITYKSNQTIKRQMFLCKCDCGNTKEYSASDLHSGVKTCGCKKRFLYKK